MKKIYKHSRKLTSSNKNYFNLQSTNQIKLITPTNQIKKHLNNKEMNH